MWYALGVLIGLCLLVALTVGVVKGITPSAPATPAPTGGGTPPPATTGTGGSSWKKKLIGWGLVVLGIVLMLWASPTLWKKLASRPSRDNGVATSAPYNVSMDTALQIRADCETGGGVAGAAHQFLPGTKTPVRNPQNGKVGTGSVGRYQINLSDPAVAKVVKDHRWDVEGSEADNRAAAEFLYQEFISKGGTDPWKDSEHCWGPKLAAMRGQQQVATLLGAVDIPVDEWSKEVDTTGHRKVCWGRIDRTKGGACRVMLDKNPRMIFPIKTPTNHVGLRVLQFNCSEAGARVEVSSSN